MFKKIAFGAVTVAVVGLLVVGAVNRTNLTLGDTASYGGRGQGATAESSQTQSGAGNGGQGRWDTAESGQAQGGAETGGRGRGDAAGAGQGATQAVVAAAGAEMSTVQGTVTSADSIQLVMTLADGSAFELGGQPWGYAQAAGFAAAAGDTIAVTGYYNGDNFEAVRLTNNRSNATAVLRADDGAAKWSGRGRTK